MSMPSKEPQQPQQPQQPSAPNGHQCCVLDLPCCIPPLGMTRAQARVDKLGKLCQKSCSGLADEDAKKIASYLLKYFDLVPAGVGKAITSGYGRWMNKSELSTEKESDKEAPRNALLSGVDTASHNDEDKDDEYDGRVL